MFFKVKMFCLLLIFVLLVSPAVLYANTPDHEKIADENIAADKMFFEAFGRIGLLALGQIEMKELRDYLIKEIANGNIRLKPFRKKVDPDGSLGFEPKKSEHQYGEYNNEPPPPPTFGVNMLELEKLRDKYGLKYAVIFLKKILTHEYQHALDDDLGILDANDKKGAHRRTLAAECELWKKLRPKVFGKDGYKEISEFMDERCS